jgi:hypothetical protein
MRGKATLVVIPTSVGNSNAKAADLHPPSPLGQLLDALATGGVLRFVETIRSQT